MATKRLISLLVLGLVILGCDRSGEPEKEPAAVVAKEDAIETGDKTKKGAAMAKESVWTWGYFFAAEDKASVQGLAGDRKQSLTLYRVDRIVAIKGKPGVDLAPGSKMVRVETASKLPAISDAKSPSLLFHGVPQHLQYTSQAQRDDLNRRSRAEIPASKDTVAVVIPIRKAAAWWAMPHDQRHAHFLKKDAKVGHTAIGAEYVERIYRKLYHTRYAVETTDHDFITYFEFAREHEADFKSLCAKLRDPQQNPEWNFVDREYEIWMTKLE
jgi:hypothetical protein